MAGFREAAAFVPATDLQLLPLRFERLRADRFFVSNLVGEGLLLNREQLDRVVSLDLSPGDGLYERAFEKLLRCGQGTAFTASTTRDAAAQSHGVPSAADRSPYLCRYAALRTLMPLLSGIPKKCGSRSF